ncbi:hypothetical protein BDW62DRAFT_195971 [Aspergillus aurantiobrunneus]
MPRKPRGPRQATVRKPYKQQQEEPLFFWSETEGEGGFLAPWYISPFTEDGTRVFVSVGHWVTIQKAKLFGDEAALKRLHATKDTDKHREIGRKIKNFDEEVWKKECYRLAVKGNFLKFISPARGNRANLREHLLRTGKRELVNASPYDRLWGIGFKALDAKKIAREQWGANQYGKALMEVRKDLAWKADPKNIAVYDTPGSGFNIDW